MDDAKHHPQFRLGEILHVNVNYDFTPIKMKLTPKIIQNNLIKDIFSTIPQTPKVVVKMSIKGPIIARELLIIIAFSIELKRIIKISCSNFYTTRQKP